MLSLGGVMKKIDRREPQILDVVHITDADQAAPMVITPLFGGEGIVDKAFKIALCILRRMPGPTNDLGLILMKLVVQPQFLRAGLRLADLKIVPSRVGANIATLTPVGSELSDRNPQRLARRAVWAARPKEGPPKSSPPVFQEHAVFNKGQRVAVNILKDRQLPWQVSTRMGRRQVMRLDFHPQFHPAGGFPIGGSLLFGPRFTGTIFLIGIAFPHFF